MKIRLMLASLALVLVPSYAGGVDRHVDNPFQVRSEVYARNGMAATSHPLATQVALDVLQQGGSAVDAAIAANAFLGFAEPTGNGIGGDLFALVWDAGESKLHALNASGRAPALATIDAIRAAGHDGPAMPPFGPLPVTVPGTVDGWFELHGRFGTLPIADVLAPAIRYAREGVPVPEQIAWYWERNLPRIGHYPGFADVFTRDGEPYRKGDVFRNPRLADTLQQIAEGGRNAFYRGDIARAIDAYMREQGGLLRYEDFVAHESEWVEPVSTNYRGYDVWQIPPNGQGIAVLQMLNIIERFDVRSMGFGSAAWMHLFAEAKKLAFEDRARFYADPAFSKVPVARLISKEYAAERAALINQRRAARAYEPGVMPEHPDTIYLTVADGEGNMVSLIQSNYRGMGSGMTPGNLGFILQNRGEAFALVPGHPNALEPNKRPFHTIIPAFVTRDGEPWLSFGLMGGAMQPQGHVQILVNLIDFDMNLQQAGDAPRMQHDGSTEPDGVSGMRDGGTLFVESGIDPAVLRRLRAMGHTLDSGTHYGGYQAIMRDAHGNYVGATESRKDGQAAGY
ncbi:MAG: gamma-glutamyltransferase [Xanthomonadaceae bacterium]|nr:gamma-glutamyltransferase [Xanthomonadaceae bacterium]